MCIESRSSLVKPSVAEYPTKPQIEPQLVCRGEVVRKNKSQMLVVGEERGGKKVYLKYALNSASLLCTFQRGRAELEGGEDP